ncbi:hypothetical protein [Ewingella americana]|uniref:Uncharacterized protein n=1 Tax=Ewingella americana TaxID=41202 RepID=A0A502GF55_9GAMM|nr:hypothetical protein [Ewingella americana]TPG59920.1 hypothetical protein EAH77_15245 [Ewingella americana]
MRYKTSNQRKQITQARLKAFPAEIKKLKASDIINRITLIKLRHPVLFYSLGRRPSIVFCDTAAQVEKLRNEDFVQAKVLEVAIVRGGFLVSPRLDKFTEPALSSLSGLELEPGLGIAFPIEGI